jgi:hypothetical protein
LGLEARSLEAEGALLLMLLLYFSGLVWPACCAFDSLKSPWGVCDLRSVLGVANLCGGCIK